MIKRIGVATRLSSAVIHNGTVYVSGLVADDTSASVFRQTEAILEKIDACLDEAGTDRTRLLAATIWLSDIGDFDEMNRAWDAWVPRGHAPARACMESRLAREEYRVEIQVTAAQ